MIFDPEYLLLAIFVLGMNVIPAFMPPTWVVLAFFYTQFQLNLIPTVLIGASMATLGRILLYHIAKNFLRNFFSKKTLENYDNLGKFFKKNQKLTIPVVLIYAFLPIPSNQVFIIAGLTEIPIGLLAFSFFAGRLISYTFWVNLAYHAVSRLEAVFSSHYSNFGAIAAEIIGFGVVYLIGKIPWKKVLKIK